MRVQRATADPGSYLVTGADTDLSMLTDLFTPSEVPTPALLLQARRNAAWRARVARAHGLLTPREVAELSGSRAVNVAATASRLHRDGRIFSVPHHGNELRYPGFQFTAEGQVRTVIAALLVALGPTGYQGWELVSWFTSANDWLDGEEPVRRLDDVEAVIAAAQAEAQQLGF